MYIYIRTLVLPSVNQSNQKYPKDTRSYGVHLFKDNLQMHPKVRSSSDSPFVAISARQLTVL